MSTELVNINSNILKLIKESMDGKGVPMPFTEEIFLLETHIAGTSFLDLDEVEPTLNKGNTFIFKREPNNVADDLAILILTEKGQKLGYVPREKNEVLARLLDAGKIIFGKMEEKNWVGTWLKLEIRIFMRDL